jgi:ankyrin repeat protein
MLQVIKYDSSKTYHRYCELKERYNRRNFGPVDDRITREAFNRGLEEVGKKAPEHDWSRANLRDRLWDILKADPAADSLSIAEFSRLRKVTALTPKKGLEVDSDLAARNIVTLHDELKTAALKVVEAYVDENNLDVKYGVDSDTALITAASQGDDAELELYLDAGCDMQTTNDKGYSAIASAGALSRACC